MRHFRDGLSDHVRRGPATLTRNGVELHERVEELVVAGRPRGIPVPDRHRVDEASIQDRILQRVRCRPLSARVLAVRRCTHNAAGRRRLDEHDVATSTQSGSAAAQRT